MEESIKISRTVREMATIPITGNVIPQAWWAGITTADPVNDDKPHKKPSPYCLAVIILADIVYWYRPAEIRDEVTGQTTGYRQRFSGDKLQRSYGSFADQFGITKRQVKAAISRLVKLNIINIEFRTIHVRGTAISNVLFLEPNPQKIRDLTPPITLQSRRGDSPSSQIPPHGIVAPTIQRNTYTGTSAKSSAKKTTTDVVIQESASPHNITSLLEMIPQSERSTKLISIVSAAVVSHGESYALSNISHAIARHNPNRGALGGLIIGALSEDYAAGKRIKASELAEAQSRAAEQHQQLEEADKRRSEELTKTARQWLESPEGKAWLSVAKSEGIHVPDLSH